MTSMNRGKLLKDFSTAWEAKDVDALMGLMADECAFRASLGPEPGMTFVGREEVRRGFILFLGPPGPPAAETVTDEPLICDDFAVTRWTTRIPQSDGEPLVVRACDIIEFAGDRIGVKDTYRKVSGDPPRPSAASGVHDRFYPRDPAST